MAARRRCLPVRCSRERRQSGVDFHQTRTGVLDVILCILLALLLAAPAKEAAGDAAATRPILVVTAVDNEYVAVRSDLVNPTDGSLGGRQISRGKVDSAEVVVIRTGWVKHTRPAARRKRSSGFPPV
jgi:hypothetical protein